MSDEKTKQIVQLGGIYVDQSFIEELKDELRMTTIAAQAGIGDIIRPSQKLAFDLLNKEGLI